MHTLQENDRLRHDLVTLEKSVTERIGYLERHKVQRSNFSVHVPFVYFNLLHDLTGSNAIQTDKSSTPVVRECVGHGAG